MEKRHIRSLRNIFLRCIIQFCLSVVGSGVIVLLIFFALLQTGLVIPANYIETMLHNSDEYMKYYQSYEWIPAGCSYVVMEEGNMIETNLSQERADRMRKEYEQGNLAPAGKYYYAFVWKNQKCIVNYELKMQYADETMNRILPGPVLTGVLLYLIIFFVAVTLLINQYTRILRRELAMVQDVTNGIRMNQLEFTVPKTKVREFNEILESLECMKQELSQSLKKQWKMEEMRKKQIQALAHDIKTPLTVVLGNADLLMETLLDEEQQGYTDKILQSTSEVESYLLQLLEVSKAEEAITIHKTEISVVKILREVLHDASVLAEAKKIRVESRVQLDHDVIMADGQAVKRICLNLISNAIEYTNPNGTILLDVKVLEANGKRMAVFQVEDSGRGFTRQELQNAAEPFYQGDESRTAKNHHGLGLYIVKSLAEHHGGSMELGSSKQYGGALVKVAIPSDSLYERDGL